MVRKGWHHTPYTHHLTGPENPHRGLPWAQVRASSAVERGHGRQVRRTIKAVAAPVILDLPGTDATRIATRDRR